MPPTPDAFQHDALCRTGANHARQAERRTPDMVRRFALAGRTLKPMAECVPATDHIGAGLHSCYSLLLSRHSWPSRPCHHAPPNLRRLVTLPCHPALPYCLPCLHARPTCCGAIEQRRYPWPATEAFRRRPGTRQPKFIPATASRIASAPAHCSRPNRWSKTQASTMTVMTG